jgi:hypothetical protein
MSDAARKAIEAGRAMALWWVQRPRADVPAEALRLARALDLLEEEERENQPVDPRFVETWCSQCECSLGPGDHGASHCKDHRGSR